MNQNELWKAISDNLHGMADAIDQYLKTDTPEEHAAAPGPACRDVPGEKPVSFEEVRTVLAGKSSEGFGSQVRELIHSYGAAKLSEVDPSHFTELLAKAQEIGRAS